MGCMGKVGGRMLMHAAYRIHDTTIPYKCSKEVLHKFYHAYCSCSILVPSFDVVSHAKPKLFNTCPAWDDSQLEFQRTKAFVAAERF